MSISLMNPIPGGVFTDPYGWRDAIPGIAPAMLHDGQDIAAPSGTPIFAAHDGTVARKWWDTWISGGAAGGNAVAILNTDLGIETRSYHMQSQSHLAVGTRVSAGDVIGYVGSTGAAVGPHLHFTLILGKSGSVDPLPYINLEGDDMPTAEEVAIAVLNHKIARKGPGQKGTTNLAAVVAYFDASINSTINGILDTPIKRQKSAMGGNTTIRAIAAWKDYGDEVTIRAIFDAAAKATGIDPEVFENTIKEAIENLGLTAEAIADATVDEQADRLSKKR